MIGRIDVGDRFAVLELGSPEIGGIVVLHPPTGAVG
jgi:hypothetical protein